MGPIRAIQAAWLKRRLARAKAENAGLRAALGLVNGWLNVRRSRRARRVKPLGFQGRRASGARGATRPTLTRWERVKLLWRWLVTCDVRYYRAAAS